MKKFLLFTLTVFAGLCFLNGIGSSKLKKYEPTWESLETRPLPPWFDEGKIGIFIHWGVYSVPAFSGYNEDSTLTHYAAWFWNDYLGGSPDHIDFMKKYYPPDFTYQDFAVQFRAEFYEPAKWAQIFSKAGAKYVVLTSKHHEGYSLYPSKYSFGWNSMDVGAKRDLTGELAAAIRENTDLKFGLYHSRYEWFNPLFRADKANGFHTDEFVRAKTLPELYEIVNLYQPEIVWSDGEFDAHSDYWQAKEFLAWLYNESPVNQTVVSNDRWGNETICKHGGFLTCTDHFNPGVLQPRKWENCMTLDRHSFSNRRNAKISDYLTPEELIKTLVETVSCGGNLLVNVGPSAEGVITPIQEERLLQMGEWLEVNGQAIYESQPWTAQNDTVTPGLWYTTNASRRQIYGIFLNWPSHAQAEQPEIRLGSVNSTIVNSIQLLGTEPATNLTWRTANPGPGIVVTLPSVDQTRSQWAWTLVVNNK